MQYVLVANNPYKYTLDDIFFQVYVDRNDLTKAEYKQAREHFFSKGQPCFRAWTDSQQKDKNLKFWEEREYKNANS